MSFLAKIYIEGRGRNVINAEILYHQFIDMHGKPSSTVQGGTLLVRVASTDADDDLYEWMFSPLMMKSGYLRFFKRDAMSRLFDLVFYDCFCVGLHESFRAYGDGGMYIDLTLIPGIQEIRGARYEKPWKKTDLDALKAAPVKNNEEEPPKVMECYFLNERNERIEKLPLGNVFLVVKTRDTVGKTVTIDLTNNQRDFLYQGKEVEGNMLSVNVTSNEQKIELEIKEKHYG